jgi:hypothetical protein
MRLRLLDRVRRSRWRRAAGRTRVRDQADTVPGPAASAGSASAAGSTPAPGSAGAPGPAGWPGPGVAPRSSATRLPRPGGAPGSVAGAHRRQGGGWSGLRGAGSQAGSPATRPAVPAGPRPPAGRQGTADAPQSPARRTAGGTAPGHALPRRWGGLGRAATRAGRAADVAAAKPGRPARGSARPPWYEVAQRNRTAVGRRHCGHIEELVHREWAEDVVPPPEIVRAIDRLAELPHLIKVKLRTGLDAIHIGAGGVPDLDDMGRLHDIPLPSGRATWDACAGAYGERKIIVGSRPSPTPDVMCHEIGHALDDLDGIGEQWQSDSEEFQSLYSRCLPHMASAFHRHPGLLGRREFFADAFAAIASRQRPALVEMLSGDTRAALNVMLYFNVRYGI